MLDLNNRDRLKIKKTLQFLKENLNLDDQWEHFKMHFDKVHPKFLEHLRKAYPSLTIYDLKQCAYMKIGLRVEEISRLMNVRPNTIQVQRYRMKQKMNLSEEITLVQFIRDLEIG